MFAFRNSSLRQAVQINRLRWLFNRPAEAVWEVRLQGTTGYLYRGRFLWNYQRKPLRGFVGEEAITQWAEGIDKEIENDTLMATR